MIHIAYVPEHVLYMYFIIFILYVGKVSAFFQIMREKKFFNSLFARSSENPLIFSEKHACIRLCVYMEYKKKMYNKFDWQRIYIATNAGAGRVVCCLKRNYF